MSGAIKFLTCSVWCQLTAVSDDPSHFEKILAFAQAGLASTMIADSLFFSFESCQTQSFKMEPFRVEIAQLFISNCQKTPKKFHGKAHFAKAKSATGKRQLSKTKLNPQQQANHVHHKNVKVKVQTQAIANAGASTVSLKPFAQNAALCGAKIW